jgi:hypothetical protein
MSTLLNPFTLPTQIWSSLVHVKNFNGGFASCWLRVIRLVILVRGPHGCWSLVLHGVFRESYF